MTVGKATVGLLFMIVVFGMLVVYDKAMPKSYKDCMNTYYSVPYCNAKMIWSSKDGK